VLSLGVVTLEVLVVDGPGRRLATEMLDFAEVLRSESEQGSSIELRVPADVVVDLGW
jgi:hypothetical protein